MEIEGKQLDKYYEDRNRLWEAFLAYVDKCATKQDLAWMETYYLSQLEPEDGLKLVRKEVEK